MRKNGSRIKSKKILCKEFRSSMIFGSKMKFDSPNPMSTPESSNSQDLILKYKNYIWVVKNIFLTKRNSSVKFFQNSMWINKFKSKVV